MFIIFALYRDGPFGVQRINFYASTKRAEKDIPEGAVFHGRYWEVNIHGSEFRYWIKMKEVLE